MFTDVLRHTMENCRSAGGKNMTFPQPFDADLTVYTHSCSAYLHFLTLRTAKAVGSLAT